MSLAMPYDMWMKSNIFHPPALEYNNAQSPEI